MVLERDFLLHMNLVRNWQFFYFHHFEFFDNPQLFSNLKVNLCDNALDMTNGTMIVGGNSLIGTYCKWLISAQDDDFGYITLEFQNLMVNIILAF